MNDFFNNVNLRIQEKMKELKLKQVDICNATGISKNAMSNYISGNRTPDTSSIYKLAQTLNTSIEYLLTGETNTMSMPSNLTVDELEMLKTYKSLSHDEKIYLKGILDGMKIKQKSKSEDKGKSSNYKTG